jgi:serine/threonine protein kinase
MSQATANDPLPEDPERLLAQFDQAWRGGKPPDIATFLSRGSADGRRDLVEELVKIDLEYRWRNAQGRCLEEYVGHLSDLGRLAELSLDLIGWEYRVRHCWGDRPSHAEYLTRFPAQSAALATTLHDIDTRLAAEFANGQKPLPETFGQNSGGVERPAPSATDARAPAFPQAELVQPLETIGASIGPYIVMERLGEGGAGQVYKARHQKMGRVAAVKVIRPELLVDEDMVRRFYREVEAVSQVQHNHIVHAYDAGPILEDGRVRGHFLAMEFLEGIDLSRLVKQSGPLPPDEAREYIRQAAVGLQYIHEQGMVHRDIKPSNLMRMASGKGPGASPEENHSASSLATSHQPLATVKILDLGLARLQRRAGGETSSALTGSNTMMMGTVDYMAPEQAIDSHAVDIRADVYSLGCTLFYLLTGQPPFPGGTEAEKLVRHQIKPAPDVRESRPEVPEELAAILAKMLAKEPSERYQSPAAVTAALAGLIAPRPSPVRKPRRGRRGIAVAAAALVAAILLVIGFLNWPSRPAANPPTSRPAVAVTKPALAPLHELRMGRFEKSLPPEVVQIVGKPSDPPLQALAFRLDGTLLAGGDKTGAIHLWDPLTAAEVGVLKEGDDAIAALAFTPDGKSLASASQAGVNLWNIAERRPLTLLRRSCPALAISPDGRHLAVSDRGNHVLLYELKDPSAAPKIICQRKQADGGIVRIVFAPDGKTLATTHYEGTAHLWNVATGNEDGEPAPGRHINSLAFTSDGKTIALGADSKPTLQVWDVATRQARALDESTGYVRWLALAPDDGHLLWNDGRMNWIRLGDKAELLNRWQPAGMSYVTALAPDRKHVAIARPDNSHVYVLRLVPKANK